MLDDLVAVIKKLQQRISDHGATLRANEIRTRTALIDPLLTALGWNVANPALVTPEYTVGEGRADYALHGSESIPAAMIEAKRLGHALNDDERMQMLNYANARGVRYAAVTDGDIWEFYEVFKQAPLEDRRLLNLRIANTSAYECALKLLLLWRPNLASGEPVAASEPLLGLASVLHTAAPETDFDSTGWVSLTEFNPPAGTKPPAAIKFPDGDETEISRWKQIPKAVADWLYAEQLLTSETLPIASGGNQLFANDKPIMRDGRPMVDYAEIGSGDIFIDVDLSANSARRSARTMLEHCGVSPDTVHLQIGE